MSPRIKLFGCAAAPIVLLMTHAALAQDASLHSQIDALRQQIDQQQQQIQQQQQQMQQQQNELQNLLDRVGQSEAQAKQAQATAAAAQKTAASKSSMALDKNNRPTWTSEDGQNSISLTSILNFDVGGYSYTPQPGQATRELQNGVNARRARIGVHGIFMKDWVYDFQYDFGSYDDNLTDTNAPKSGVKSAYISFLGLPVVFDLGYLSVPYTLDQATANVDYMFMEHPISEALAIAVAGGDSRSAFGARYFTDRFWSGIYLTGPKAGTSHTTGEQLGLTARATYQLVQEGDTSLHFGADFAQLLQPPGTHTLNFTIEPELSIDPTALAGVTLGSTTHPLRGMSVYSIEAAGGWRSLFFQGEGFLYRVDEAGLLSNTFSGGYFQTSWTMTGEHRQYLKDSGAYSRINPAKPFSISEGTWGAWEIAARISDTDLNSNFTRFTTNTGSAINGGNDIIGTLGLNWYPNNNIMFRINYLHGLFDDLYTNITSAPKLQQPAGAHFDAVAMRAQVTF